MVTAARGGLRLAGTAVLFCTVLILIAVVGGGWLALGRVDPLLAVPGAGWAAVATVATLRRRIDSRSVGIVAGGTAVVLAAIALAAASQLPFLQIAIAFAACVVALGATAMVISLSQHISGMRGRRIVGALSLVALAIGWQQVGWAVVPVLYDLKPAHGPRVTLMTALPLIHSASPQAQLRGDVTIEPILPFLTTFSRLETVDSLTARQLARTDVLLLAHPRALPPATLVLIDAWTRNGGHTVILADGLLTWPPPLPLGDARNPPVTSLLTPLLSHWGLRLDAPDPRAAPVQDRMVGPLRLRVENPGRFALTAGECCTSSEGLRADCELGKGTAILVADADFLQDKLWQGARHTRGAAAWSSANALWLKAAIQADRTTNSGSFVIAPVWTVPSQ